MKKLIRAQILSQTVSTINIAHLSKFAVNFKLKPNYKVQTQIYMYLYFQGSFIFFFFFFGVVGCDTLHFYSGFSVNALTGVLFVHLFALRLFGFVCFLFLFVSGMGYGL